MSGAAPGGRAPVTWALRRMITPGCGRGCLRENTGRVNRLTTASLGDPESFPPTKAVFPEQKLSWA